MPLSIRNRVNASLRRASRSLKLRKIYFNPAKENTILKLVLNAKYRKLINCVEHYKSFSHCFQQESNNQLENILRTCLQTLIYLNWLDKVKKNLVLLQGNLLVDVKRSPEYVYWKVKTYGEDFMDNGLDLVKGMVVGKDMGGGLCNAQKHHWQLNKNNPLLLLIGLTVLRGLI